MRWNDDFTSGNVKINEESFDNEVNGFSENVTIEEIF